MPHQPRFNITICTMGANPNLWNIVRDFRSFISSFDSESVLTVIFNGEVSIPDTVNERIRYFLEGKLGYATVRNKALEVNPTGFNLIFIDDDEIISLEWLNNFRKGHLIFPLAVLAGPVEPLNEHKFSYRRSTANRLSVNRYGDLMSKAPSSNLLIPNIVTTNKLCFFDEFFNRGGEDTDLTYRLSATGVEIRWISDAKIHEFEDASRLNKQWLTNRQIKDSQNHSLAYRRNHTRMQNCVFFAKLLRNLFASAVLVFFNHEYYVKVLSNYMAINSMIKGKF